MLKEEKENNQQHRRRKDTHTKKEVFGGKNVVYGTRLFDARNMLHNTQKKKKAGGIARHVRDTFVFNTWLFSVL